MEQTSGYSLIIAIPLLCCFFCNVLGKPWEPYQEMGFEQSLRAMKDAHDLVYGGFDLAKPIVEKLGREKFEDYQKKYHGPKSVAGKAGSKVSSEESSSDSVESKSDLGPVRAPPPPPPPPPPAVETPSAPDVTKSPEVPAPVTPAPAA